MRTVNIILLVFATILLARCKKEADKPYPDDYIIRDNAMAIVYFHTVFREAENAWAFIDNENYEMGDYSDPASTPPTKYKNLTYDDETNTVTVEYHAWVSSKFLLNGNMYVTLKQDSYRVHGEIATVTLSDFSINGQMVTGESRITYQKVENSDNDRYNYVHPRPANIHEMGISMPVLISGTIANGRYERIAGGETLTQDDDAWTYTGRMTGSLGNNLSLKYTNEILSGEDGTVHFTTECNFAEQGISKITIPGRSDITCYYSCDGVDYDTVSHVD